MTDQITVPRETWDAMREALLKVARMAEALKRDCGMDHESKQAIRNGEYMNISYVAREALAAANAVSDHFCGVTEMVQPLGWYCVSRDGLATQCADQRDAELTAKSANRDWPNSAPYRAVQLCEFEAHPQATEPAGYKLVPVDPTQKMIDAFHTEDGESACNKWDAMLAAAPAPKESDQ